MIPRNIFPFVIIFLTLVSQSIQAASKEEIDIKIDFALERFQKEVDAGKIFLERAKGVLVFPEVIKAGFGIGGEYGEGALRIGGNSVDYYNTASASIGSQLGVQIKKIILIFLDDSELKKFGNSDNWEAGIDGSVVLIDYGAGKDITTTNINDPIIGFVINNKGLMYNLTLEGTKITKLKK
ncbi:MAG: lipid-binding SYLF domain-containing protein [Gammaproteobacteria bacterium]|jgi:lipid-binding SYLF domain-containing protein